MSGQSNEGTMGTVLEREFLEFLETKEQIHEWIKVNTCGKNGKIRKKWHFGALFRIPRLLRTPPYFLNNGTNERRWEPINKCSDQPRPICRRGRFSTQAASIRLVPHWKPHVGIPSRPQPQLTLNPHTCTMHVGLCMGEKGVVITYISISIVLVKLTVVKTSVTSHCFRWYRELSRFFPVYSLLNAVVRNHKS